MKDTTSFATATVPERRDLFCLGDFVLNSGRNSRWKLECDALTDGDIETLAHLIRSLVGPYTEVVGVPNGGLRLAAALCKYVSVGLRDPILIVDDVLTTGGSMQRTVEQVYSERSDVIPSGGDPFVGAVVFARGQCPRWVKAVFQMPEEFWPEARKRG